MSSHSYWDCNKAGSSQILKELFCYEYVFFFFFTTDFIYELKSSVEGKYKQMHFKSPFVVLGLRYTSLCLKNLDKLNQSISMKRSQRWVRKYAFVILVKTIIEYKVK